MTGQFIWVFCALPRQILPICKLNSNTLDVEPTYPGNSDDGTFGSRANTPRPAPIDSTPTTSASCHPNFSRLDLTIDSTSVVHIANTRRMIT